MTALVSTSAIQIRAEYDASHDVYIVYPCCKIATEADCLAWYHAYKEVFANVTERIDCIVSLDMFSVEPGIAACWQGYRERLYTELVRYAVRMHSDTSVTLLSAGPHKRQRNTSQVARDIPEAEPRRKVYIYVAYRRLLLPHHRR